MSATAVGVTTYEMFKHSSIKDRLLTAIGCLVAVATGCCMPTLVTLMGYLVGEFIIFQSVIHELCDNSTKANIPVIYMMPKRDQVISIATFQQDVRTRAIEMALVGTVMLVCNVVIVGSLGRSATKQAFRIRHIFMRAILHQDVAWFDEHSDKNFAPKILEDLGKIQDGLGENIGMCCFFLSTTVTSLLCALYHGWLFTLSLLLLTPLLQMCIVFVGRKQLHLEGREALAYSNASSCAQEALAFIKTVVAYGGQNKEIKRYEGHLQPVKETAIQRGLMTGFGVSLVWVFMYANYSLGFWLGTSLILQDANNPPESKVYDISALLIVFFNVLMATTCFIQATPYFQAFAMAKRAASSVYPIIDRKPTIDSASSEGLRPPELEGWIHFKSVTFCYPSAPESKVLQSFSLGINPGETIALVGVNGSGRSTILKLLTRFYDITEGQILIDHRDIRSYNIGWLRGQMGIVCQNPVLFNTTVAENIRYGLATATQADIQEAAIAAHAHKFILKLPQKYDTPIGEGGVRLTSSEVRRIAIARALVRNPKVLLLDDPTSAQDAETEAVVKAVLDKVREGRTTVIASSRLSTIRNADLIVVMKAGRIIETGTHKALVKSGSGPYMELLKSENMQDEDSDLSSGAMAQLGFSPSQMPAPTSIGMMEDMDEGVEVPADAEETTEDHTKRLLQLAEPERSFLVAACVCATLMGLPIPIYAVCLGDMMQASCSRLSALCQAFTTLLATVVLSLYWDWHLCFIVLVFVPLILFSTYLEVRMMHGKLMSSRKALEVSDQIAIEAIQNARTIASLHQEEVFCAKYVTSLAIPQSISKRKSYYRGFSFGVAQCIRSLAFACALVYGSILMEQCDLQFGSLFKVIEASILGTSIIGQAAAYTPGYKKAKVTATKIFKLMDTVPKIDFMDSSGTTLNEVYGYLTFNEVSFHYANQQNAKALDHVTFSVEPGQMVAIVGPSYSGKTTSIDLVERFYDVTEGDILLDQIRTRLLNISWMRKQLGYVSDPPFLYGYSIAENIAYGDNERDVPLPEIIAAAQVANVHDFITTLKQGYDTRITYDSDIVSRAELKRIALARALVRDPKILLIDDAVAGLDTVHELATKAAIKQASRGRTCVVSTNRLYSVTSVDRIFVMQKGRVVEKGSHVELMLRRGVYYNLFVDEMDDREAGPNMLHSRESLALR
ncbi:phosphatidylcholine translocator ABCB4-like isoform X3 [Ornithodoros turicata]|uniref:phosphatidylcholine translocator ABCB4-like isoform X3 n=1 Tax=Ornithodoros turicata TaxID=34597 RepID=UPI0031387949